MSFGDFLKNVGQTFTPPKRIRDWRKLKRQYRRYLQGLGQDAQAVRQGVQAWIKNNPKPKRTKKEREKIYSDIPQLYREGRDLVGGNGANGVESATFTGVTPGVRTAGFNPLLLLLLIPLVFPKQSKKFFNI
tara:strand:- start:84 stop:479 length:396 start_codon:yes stop_codon:yes gene_type:complete